MLVKKTFKRVEAKFNAMPPMSFALLLLSIELKAICLQLHLSIWIHFMLTVFASYAYYLSGFFLQCLTTGHYHLQFYDFKDETASKKGCKHGTTSSSHLKTTEFPLLKHSTTGSFSQMGGSGAIQQNIHTELK